uniref:NADH-quinone oxidoreductase subunit L n=1 Tax=Candidatus Aschnera chinzeii TaxID=1485666 RepID=A0AAT9G4A9_9ENTR|nr:MAG: NADH-quinone oxidoreductase subunit L [Candidatus Aschnera chinzeii]
MKILSLTIIIPILGFFIFTYKTFISKKIISNVAIILNTIHLIITLYITIEFYKYNYNNISINLWPWININTFNIQLRLFMDGLSLTMLLLISAISFLIVLYSTWYMQYKKYFARFFAYINLFIFGMILLILADNIVIMYIGWEIVGICSYLLIGFYSSQLKAGKAAVKAFLITKISDVFFMIGICLLYNQFNTLNFHEINTNLLTYNTYNTSIINYIAAMILIGAIGKSAQLPLHIWLTEAMTGPTPASALIHAATMVTAGVYLIAKTHILFIMTPKILTLIIIIGLITLLMGGIMALIENNLKQILAYSTISQIGYMFLALGLQSWEASITHLISHAFFKALLFLSSGSIISICNQNQNIKKMGGLWNKIPIIYVCFLIGGASLSGIPYVTAGFYSKENIFYATYINNNNIILYGAYIGEMLTIMYVFRMIINIFHGNKYTCIKKTNIHCYSHNIPLIILTILSTFIGSWLYPPLKNVFPTHTTKDINYLDITEYISIITFILTSLIIIFFNKKKINIQKYFNIKIKIILSKLQFYMQINAIYNSIFILPFKMVTKKLKIDPINTSIYLTNKYILNNCNKKIKLIQNGNIQSYLIYMLLGELLILTLLLLS